MPIHVHEQDPSAWAILAAHALEQGAVEVARDAYAALCMVDRVWFLDEVLGSPAIAEDGSTPLVNVMALLGREQDVEAQLVQVSSYNYDNYFDLSWWSTTSAMQVLVI